MKAAAVAAALLLAASAAAAEPEVGLTLARSTKEQETDIVRLTYRAALPPGGKWWMPSQLQFGASVWRVPDLGGVTRRLDLSLTPIWRSESSWGYVEGGVGVGLQHLSNAGIKQPNGGINLVLFGASFAF